MEARIQSVVLLLMITLLQPSANTSLCPRRCHCQTYHEPATSLSVASLMNFVSCDSLGLKSIPRNIHPNVTHLSLQNNQISVLEEDVLNRLQNLERLDLSSNRLTRIYLNHFRHLFSLRELILSDNPIKDISIGAFDHLTSLETLDLSETFIETVPVFTLTSSVVHLHLDNTNIQELTEDSLRHYSKLEGLYLKRSKIKRLVNGVFQHAEKLKYLLMEYSNLNHIEEDAFDGVQLHTLALQGTHIRTLPVNGLEELVNLNLEDVYNLWQLHASHLPKIRRLLLTYEFLCCSFVENVFDDTWEVGRQEHGVLQECKYATGVAPSVPSFRSALNPQGTQNSNGSPSNLLEKSSTRLTSASRITPSPILPKDFISRSSKSSMFTNQPTAPVSKIRSSSLANSSSSRNKILSPSFLSSNLPIKLRKSVLNIGKESTSCSSTYKDTTNEFKSSTTQSDKKHASSLPTSLPTPTSHTKLPSIHSTYSLHPTKLPLKFSSRLYRRTTRMRAQNDFITLSYNDSLLVFTLDPCDLGPLPTGRIEVSQLRKKRVICRPKPDDFNPCEDMLGSMALRLSTWLISVFAAIGNLVTLFVILLNRRKVSNHKLLMCTLAFSSLCMAVYLIILAAVDARTKGNYNKYAKRWQHGIGCKVAGFLSIFSTELSVFTLNIITLERYYTILFPLHQTKWMTIRQTTISLVLSFLAALVLAALPLTGISSYTKVAICLPFDVTSLASKAYVTFLLASNGAFFFAVLFAYIKMYLNIQHTARVTFADLNIARKMAVIVLTNFTCWAPVATFSLIAIYGEPLMDVPTSKFLMVFVFPINALANPFLYFLVTKRFQQDLRTMLDRCLCCAGSSYVRRERTTSFIRTSLTRTTKSRSRSGSGNSVVSMFRRSPGRVSTDTQSSTPRHSVPRGSEDRRFSVVQRTVTFLLPILNAGRLSKGDAMTYNPKIARRKSYDLAVENNMLPDSMTCLFSNQKDQHSDYEGETPHICESAC